MPLLEKNHVIKIWPNLKKFVETLKNQILIDEAKLLIEYFQNQWINKYDNSNLWNFHRLARTRSINPAESFHSSMKRNRFNYNKNLFIIF